jgi:hypothetical protein
MKRNLKGFVRTRKLSKVRTGALESAPNGLPGKAALHVGFAETLKGYLKKDWPFAGFKGKMHEFTA